MAEARILDFNYVFQSQVGVSASSEDSEFPAENLRNHLRSKCWRSSGYFVIDSGNNKVNFKESSMGSELTATLTAGAYSATELADEIVLALEAVGAEEYTASLSSTTGRWTISHAGAYLSLLWASGTDTANTLGGTIGFDETSDSTGATSYVGAAVAIHTEEFVTFDLRTWGTNPIDSLALVWDPTEGPGLSQEATLTLQASQTQNWASPSVSVSLSIDDTYGTATHFFSSSQNYRYWRVKIVDPRNPNLCVQLGKVLLSKATQLGQMPEIGFTQSCQDLSTVESNEYGHQYGDIYPQVRSLEINYTVMDQADIETLYEIYQRVGKSVPIAIALDPTAAVWDKDRFFLYGRLQGNMQIAQKFYNYFDTGLALVEAM